MRAEDRNSLVILKRWAQNPGFLRADVTFCLIAENLIELNPGWCRTPASPPSRFRCPTSRSGWSSFDRSCGDAAARRARTSPPEALAKLGAGLKRVQLQSLIAHASENRQPLTLKFLTSARRN